MIVANVGGAPVRVSDIGSVEDGVEEPRSLAQLDGMPAVVLEVRKQSGTNTLEVIKAVKERVAEIQKDLPPDFRITLDARSIHVHRRDRFNAVQEHLVLGGFLAALIVLLFIRNWRATLIAAIAIPTSIISTYTLMQWMGFTLNQITMLALTLVVGIVIDDAIVVLENIFRFAEEKKLGPVEAALEGTRDIGLAVLATTLSLVIIFLPVAHDERHRGALHVELRLHRGVRHHGFAAGELHPHPDALLALPEAHRRRERHERYGAVPRDGGALPAHAAVVHAAPLGRGQSPRCWWCSPPRRCSCW